MRSFSVGAVLGLVLGVLLAPAVAQHLRAPLAPVRAEMSAALPAGGLPIAQAAEVVRVIDGDTFEARVHVWPGIDVTTKIRLRGVDAPELKARCAAERTRAEAARDGLGALLAQGGVVVSHVALDKYGGRVLADAATRATADVGRALLAKDLARPYEGGRREPWCGPGLDSG